MHGGWRVMDVWMNGRMGQCMTPTFPSPYPGLHLRKDEEEGCRADQEACGRAHRDEGAGFQ